MTFAIEFTRLAQLDLDELIVYIGEANPKAAVSVSSRILARIDLLQNQPELGRKGKLPDTRELVVDGTRYIRAPSPRPPHPAWRAAVAREHLKPGAVTSRSYSSGSRGGS